MMTYLIMLCFIICGFYIGGWWSSYSTRYASSSTQKHTSSIIERLFFVMPIALFILTSNITYEWLVAIPFIIALSAITISDYHYMIIPDIITLPGILVMLILRILVQPLPYWNYVTAALLGGGIFIAIKLIAKVILKGEAIGDGDIKLLFLTGLVLGFKLTVLSFIIICFLGPLVGVLLIIRQRRNDSFIPFGPIIAFSSFITYLWGNDLLQYISNAILF